GERVEQLRRGEGVTLARACGDVQIAPAGATGAVRGQDHLEPIGGDGEAALVARRAQLADELRRSEIVARRAARGAEDVVAAGGAGGEVDDELIRAEPGLVVQIRCV